MQYSVQSMTVANMHVHFLSQSRIRLLRTRYYCAFSAQLLQEFGVNSVQTSHFFAIFLTDFKYDVTVFYLEISSSRALEGLLSWVMARKKGTWG